MARFRVQGGHTCLAWRAEQQALVVVHCRQASWRSTCAQASWAPLPQTQAPLAPAGFPTIFHLNGDTGEVRRYDGPRSVEAVSEHHTQQPPLGHVHMHPGGGPGISQICAAHLQLHRFASGGWGEVEPLPFWDSPTSGWGRLVGFLHRCWNCMVCTSAHLQSASPQIAHLSEMLCFMQPSIDSWSMDQLLAPPEGLLSAQHTSWPAGVATDRRYEQHVLLAAGPCLSMTADVSKTIQVCVAHLLQVSHLSAP